jgi:hypothetical protein
MRTSSKQVEYAAGNQIQAPDPRQTRVPDRELESVGDNHERALSSLDTARIVPAVAFPKFRLLPVELQRLVWSLAIPTLVRAYYDYHKRKFLAPGPQDAVIEIALECGETYKTLNMDAIYLPDKYLKSPWPHVRSEPLEPIYLRPRLDILYLPELSLLDQDEFLAQLENHILQSIAIRPSSGGTMSWVSSFFRGGGRL